MRTRIASAGTGKTTYLISRLLELTREGTPLRRVAAITYTRRAANDLKLKLRMALEQLHDDGHWLNQTLEPQHRPTIEGALRELDGSNIGTIHGFLANLLRLVAPTITLDPDFSVIGEHDAIATFREEAATHAFLTNTPIPDRTMSRLEQLFRQRSLATTFHATHEGDQELLALYNTLTQRYWARLDNRALAPADLELKAVEAARYDIVLERWRERVSVALIDESQDLNPVQGAFLERLEASGIQIEAVGDPKQSIYAFRHADLDTFRRIITNSQQGTPLNTTYRHSRVITRFLNGLTRNMGAEDRGFTSSEAPEVTPARQELGSLRIHWVQTQDRTGIDKLRAHEAELMAHSLKHLHENEGVPYDDMAVLMRSRASQPHVQAALERNGVPTVIVQGRNYYRQSEIRDLVHALKLIHAPTNLSLAAWLHSPYAQLDTNQLHAVLSAQEPLEHLKQHHPQVLERLHTIQGMKNLHPSEILTRLARDPLVGGKAYTELLDAGAADNVDTMLVLAAPAASSSLDALIHTLDELAKQEEVGDVPQAGDGVKLTTVHASKGLEWPAVAVFDLGRGAAARPQEVIVEPHSGRIATPDNPEHQDLQAQHTTREEQESFRLLYVALSRARDHMILTGSIKGDSLTPAIRELAALKLGPGKSFRADEGRILVHTAEYQPIDTSGIGDPITPEALPIEEWSTTNYPHASAPLILRPSHAQPHEHVKSEEETLGAGASDSLDDAIPSIIGTLTHYGIAQGWKPDDQGNLKALDGQVILAALDDKTRAHVRQQVLQLLAAHQAMLGNQLPTNLTEEHRELPFLHTSEDGRIWNGVIDHLYQHDGHWYLDDYKTDAKIDPEQHEPQMRLYAEAASAWTGETPKLRLVYLRHGQVIPIQPEAILEHA